MKTIICLLILFAYSQTKINNVEYPIKFNYWFMGYLAEEESNHYQFAYNKKSTATGEYQITTTPYGGLQYWNDFHPNEQYKPADLFNPEIALKIATWIIKQNLKVFNNNIVLAVNSYNMGIGNSRKNRIYYRYCCRILGAGMVNKYLKDYILLKKSKNGKVLYIAPRLHN